MFSSLSFTFVGELVVLGIHGKQSGPVDRNTQYSVPDEQVEDVLTVLPVAKFPTGGKQPACCVHCELHPIGNETSTAHVISNVNSFVIVLDLGREL